MLRKEIFFKPPLPKFLNIIDLGNPKTAESVRDTLKDYGMQIVYIQDPLFQNPDKYFPGVIKIDLKDNQCYRFKPLNKHSLTENSKNSEIKISDKDNADTIKLHYNDLEKLIVPCPPVKIDIWDVAPDKVKQINSELDKL